MDLNEFLTNHFPEIIKKDIIESAADRIWNLIIVTVICGLMCYYTYPYLYAKHEPCLDNVYEWLKIFMYCALLFLVVTPLTIWLISKIITLEDRRKFLLT